LLAERQAIDAQIASLGCQIKALKRTEETCKFSDEEKFKIFYSLFAGRGDVFAKGYKTSSGKIGYQPVCTNLFDTAKCAKSRANNLKTKCSQCIYQSYRPMAINDFREHLNGNSDKFRDVLGSYPMDKDEQCLFIVADFDAKADNGATHETAKMRKTVLAFYDECVKRKIPAYLEVSRSGYGVHIWTFFDKPVPAPDARKMFASVLTAATASVANVDFKYYDRFLPTQDTLPRTGSQLGNLIALPLQGQAMRQGNGNSMFVNRDFVRYKDQWAFLSNITKMGAATVAKFVCGLSSVDVYGEFVSADTEDEKQADNVKPWVRQHCEQELTDTDFTGSIEIHFANMLYIDITKLSTRAVNALRRLASFKNPEFYKNQAMHLNNWDTPSILTKAVLRGQYIGLPRGVLTKLMDMLSVADVKFTLVDDREGGQPIKVEFKGQLKPAQRAAQESLLKYDNGILCAPPGFGKTVTAASMIAKAKTNTLIILDKAELLKQWKESLNGFLEINEDAPTYKTPTGRVKLSSKIGEYHGSKKRLSGIIDIATFQSLIDKDGVKDFIKDYGMVIVDECHHVPSNEYQAVLDAITAKRVYGLTATPKRADGHEAVLYLECGPIRYKMSVKEQVAKHSFNHYIIPRITPVLGTSVKNADDFLSASNAIVDIEPRNQLICGDIKDAISKGRNPIVLTERVKHAEYLAGTLAKDIDNVLLMLGKSKAAEKKRVHESMAALAEGEPFVLVTTSKLIGEGFDFPRLDTLFLTMPISNENRVMQYTGRLHREYAGKAEVVVYDYVDAGIPVLERSFNKRMRTYNKIGYSKLQEDLPIYEQPSVFFDASSYLQSYMADVSQATKEIVISAPGLQKAKIGKLIPVLTQRLAGGTSITVLVKPIDEISSKTSAAYENNIIRLRNAGIATREVSGLRACFTALDQHVLWYGGINPLGYTQEEETVIRVDDSTAAVGMLNGIN
jgi:superfamily II DNA or RNA helicase